MMIDTISFLIPDAKFPKEIDHRVEENRYPEMVLPGSLKGIGEDRIGSDRDAEETAERDAIQNEERYETRQSIPEAQMVAGLIRMARWQR
jgi:hypothetical protein